MAHIESLLGDVWRRGDAAFAEHDGVRSVVWLRGEHDLVTVAALAKIVAKTIVFDDSDVVFDLNAVKFMDASTVGVIVSANELLGHGSRSLALRSPSACARRLIDVCGLGELVDADRVDADGVDADVG